MMHGQKNNILYCMLFLYILVFIGGVCCVLFPNVFPLIRL